MTNTELIEEQRSTLKRVGWFNLLLATFGFACTLYLVVLVLNNPLAGGKVGSLLPIMLTSGLFINRSYLMLQRVFKSPSTTFVKVLLMLFRWCLTIILPVFFIAYVNNAAESKGIALIEHYFQPVIDEIETYRQQSGHPPKMISKTARLNIPQSFIYYYDDGHYMLQTAGGSIDIDGSTLFYNSESSSWQKLHNDVIHAEGTPQFVESFLKIQQSLTSVTYQKCK